MQSVTHESQRKTSLLHWPHRAAVIAVRIKGRMPAGKGAHSPAGEQLFRHQPLGCWQDIIVIHNSRGETVARVRRNGAYGTAMIIQAQDKVSLFLHPELFVEAFFQLAGLMKKFSGRADFAHEEP